MNPYRWVNVGDTIEAWGKLERNPMNGMARRRRKRIAFNVARRFARWKTHTPSRGSFCSLIFVTSISSEGYINLSEDA